MQIDRWLCPLHEKSNFINVPTHFHDIEFGSFGKSGKKKSIDALLHGVMLDIVTYVLIIIFKNMMFMPDLHILGILVMNIDLV